MSYRKYGNRKTEVDGIVFDSKKEAEPYIELRMMEEAGEISNLQRQVPYVLIQGQRWSDGKKRRDTIYRPDFVYFDRDGTLTVEDVKGVLTEAYKIKKALMKDRFGIEIREV